MRDTELLIAELCGLIERHARDDLRTPLPGLLLSRTAPSAEPDYSLTEPLLIVLARGATRLQVGEREVVYRAGDSLLVTATVPVTGTFLNDGQPALALGLELRPAAVAAVLLDSPDRRAARASTRSLPEPPTLEVGRPDHALLDAVARLLRLLDSPGDAAMLAPLLEREILWRLVSGQHGPALRRIGLADSALTHVSRAIAWLRAHLDQPVRIVDLADLAAMSPSTFHRNFRAITELSPLQFQQRLRLQEARAMLVADPGDVAGVAHRVGYGSPSQFSREYRRLFGAPPGQDAARLRAGASSAGRSLP